MRSTVGRSVRQEFEAQLRAGLPQFTRVTNLRLDSGIRLYEWGYDPRLRFFIVLNTHRSEDAFTIEVAWSRNGKWPDGHVALPHTPPLETPSGEARFRIGMLWSTNPDYWWQVSPGPSIVGPNRTSMDSEALWRHITNPPPLADTLARVPAVVGDAIGRIKAFVVPYFERVAANAGGSGAPAAGRTGD